MRREVLSNSISKEIAKDSNNNYINLSNHEVETLQLLEPQIKPLDISDRIAETYDIRRTSYRIPIVYIDDYRIEQIYITAFELDYSSFVPTVSLEFLDVKNYMGGVFFPRDGSLIKIYIGGLGDERFYKPIRQDFFITSFQTTNRRARQNYGEYMSYRVTGTLNVPYGFRKTSDSMDTISAMDALYKCAVDCGLGFATNFNEINHNCDAPWLNPCDRQYFDFMRDIAEHCFYSKYTFYTAFIDQYYVLNFVECHRLLSHGGDPTDTIAYLYNMVQNVNESEALLSNVDESDRAEVAMALGQEVSYYFLTNHSDFASKTNYIVEYSEINNGSSSLRDGYSKHVCYPTTGGGVKSMDEKNATYFANDKDKDVIDSDGILDMDIFPIDNLEEEGNKIKNLPDECGPDTYIPLNIAQVYAKIDGSVANKDIYDTVSMSSSVTLTDVPDKETTFMLYPYAKIHNNYQMDCLKKCGLKVKLESYNPSISRFSRIWVDIYDMGDVSNNIIEGNSNATNDDILPFPISEDEGYYYKFEFDPENHTYKKNRSVRNTNYPRGNYNRSLSGWYVVTEMKIVFNKDKKMLQTILTLNRIEYRPLQKSVYERARDVINGKNK